MGISVDLTGNPTENMAQCRFNNNGGNPEEGEIVDDFDDIISSDEELSMRKRIEELEARNSELEKLANISGYYGSYDLGTTSDRYKSGYSPIEKILNGDFPRSAPNLYAKQRRPLPVVNHVERYKPHSPALRSPPSIPPPPILRKHDYNPPRIAQYLPRSYHNSRKRKYEKSKRNKSAHKKQRTKSRKKARFDYGVSSDEEICSLDRRKLQKAVRYEPVEVKVNSTDYPAKRISSSPRKSTDSDDVIIVNDQSNKHEESDDSESQEIQELRLIALKSAFLGKDRKRKQRKEIEQKTPYSPTDFLQPMTSLEVEIPSPKEFMDMEISPINSPGSSEDELRPIDMELVDSSDSSCPEFADHQSYWKPIHSIEEIPLPRGPSYHYARQEASPKHRANIISPIAIRNHTMPLKNASDDIIDEANEDEKVQIVSDENASPEPTDEEELALRALLLAQKNSPKFIKDVKAISKPSEQPPDLKPPIVQSMDPLKMIMQISQGPPDKTAEILKEAVKRLQNKTSDDENVKIQESTNTIPTISYPKPIQTIITQFPNDVDYRHFGGYMNAAGNAAKPLQVAQSDPSRISAPVNIQVKENVYVRATRPNNVEIIPTKIVQRPIKKPLSDITETDNVAIEISSKPKNLEVSVKLDSQPIESVESKNIIPNAAEANSDKAQPELKRPHIKSDETKLEPLIEPPKIVEKNLPSQNIGEDKRQRKRSTSLEILQLKTQNLISSGKFVSRNKVVAAKLLNKAIHHNSLILKRKITQKLKPTEDARLIKTIEVPQVKPIVINITSKSDSDSDDSFDEMYGNNVERILAQQESEHNDLYDVASPMSLPMESPRDSPLTVLVAATKTTPSRTFNSISTDRNIENKLIEDTPIKTKESVVNVAQKSTKEEKKEGTFEAKLEEFLKNARSKVELVKKDLSVLVAKSSLTEAPQKAATTPAAVKHLPISSQLEYRRLISRMQMLEKQKLAKTLPTVTAKESTLKITIKNNLSPEKLGTEPAKKATPLKMGGNVISDIKSIAISSQSNVGITRTVHYEKNPAIQMENEVQVTMKNELTCRIESTNNEEADNNVLLEIEKESVKDRLSNEIIVVPETESQQITAEEPVAKNLQENTKKFEAKSPLKTSSILNPSTISQDPKPLTTTSGRVVRQTSSILNPPTINQDRKSLTTTSARLIRQTYQRIDQPPKLMTAKLKAKLTPAKVGATRLKSMAGKKLKLANSTGSNRCQNGKSTVPTLPKLNELRTNVDCEKQYRESSCNLLENISKTIKLVITAQNEKREQLLLKQELDKLRKKMIETEEKFKEKETAIADIYPKISSSHKLIVALKDQTTNLDQLSIDLSKRLGENRNNNFYTEQKNKIKSLSKELSLEIKKLKDLKITDASLEKVVKKNVVPTVAIKPNIQDEAIHVDLVDEVCDNKNDTVINETNNRDLDTMVSPMTNSNNDQLVSGNFNKPDSISPLPSSPLPELISTNATTDVGGESAIERENEEAKSPSAQSDMKNVQNSLEIDKDKFEGGNGNREPMKVAPRASTRLNGKETSPMLPRLYHRMCEAANMEDQNQKHCIGHKNDYVSPLTFSADNTESLNPHGILCPYQLMGQCDDKECKYEHLST